MVTRVGKPRLAHPLRREVELLLGNGEAGDLAAELPRREFGKSAPAATDLEHILARAHARAFGEQPIFARLRGGEIIVARREDGRRIGHRLVEPALVKGVAEIVMGVDVLPRAGTRVAIERMAEKLEHPLHEAPRHDLVDDLAVDAHELDERLEAWRLPFSLQIGFPEAELSGRQEAPREIVILDDELGLRARRAAIEMHLAPVRKDGRERAGAQAGRRLENLADEVRHIGWENVARCRARSKLGSPSSSRHRITQAAKGIKRRCWPHDETAPDRRQRRLRWSAHSASALSRMLAHPRSPQARPDHSRAASDRP